MKEGVKTLLHAKSGEMVRVQDILGGRKMRNRLMELGVMEGTPVKVYSNEGGPLIILVGNSRFALGQGVAQKVTVK